MKNYEVEIKLTTVRKVEVVAANQEEVIEIIDELIEGDDFDSVEVVNGDIEIMIGKGEDIMDFDCKECPIVALCCPSKH